MKADPKDQQRLLDVQAIDTALQQLAHRRERLPEHAEVQQLAAGIKALEEERATAAVAVSDLDRDIAKLEREVDAVRQRRDKDQGRLDDGRLPARELTALEHEIASLARRQSELEDVELELMERREGALEHVASIERRLHEAQQQHEATAQRLGEALGAIAKDEEWKRSARGPLVAGLPAELVALYDKLRESSGGIGAALLQHGRCGGCRVELYGADLVRVKASAPDDVVRCEECRRIMVRTVESGL